MTVRTKFKVSQIIFNAHWRAGNPIVGTVRLVPVTCGSPENDAFYEATPCGQFEIGTINKEALDQFQIGKEFYVDLTPA